MYWELLILLILVLLILYYFFLIRKKEGKEKRDRLNTLFSIILSVIISTTFAILLFKEQQDDIIQKEKEKYEILLKTQLENLVVSLTADKKGYEVNILNERQKIDTTLNVLVSHESVTIINDAIRSGLFNKERGDSINLSLMHLSQYLEEYNFLGKSILTFLSTLETNPNTIKIHINNYIKYKEGIVETALVLSDLINIPSVKKFYYATLLRNKENELKIAYGPKITLSKIDTDVFYESISAKVFTKQEERCIDSLINEIEFFNSMFEENYDAVSLLENYAKRIKPVRKGILSLSKKLNKVFRINNDLVSKNEIK